MRGGGDLWVFLLMRGNAKLCGRVGGKWSAEFYFADSRGKNNKKFGGRQIFLRFKEKPRGSEASAPRYRSGATNGAFLLAFFAAVTLRA
jgi:hypothetical protein